MIYFIDSMVFQDGEFDEEAKGACQGCVEDKGFLSPDRVDDVEEILDCGAFDRLCVNADILSRRIEAYHPRQQLNEL